MDIDPNRSRLKRLSGLTPDDIGLDIMFCPDCDYQIGPGVACVPICPGCFSGLHIATIDQELLDLVYDAKSLPPVEKDALSK